MASPKVIEKVPLCAHRVVLPLFGLKETGEKPFLSAPTPHDAPSPEASSYVYSYVSVPGCAVGFDVGFWVVGLADFASVGLLVGGGVESVGGKVTGVGFSTGGLVGGLAFLVGFLVVFVGLAVGWTVGFLVVGHLVGLAVRVIVGFLVVGHLVGLEVGKGVGTPVGRTVTNLLGRFVFGFFVFGASTVNSTDEILPRDNRPCSSTSMYEPFGHGPLTVTNFPTTLTRGTMVLLAPAVVTVAVTRPPDLLVTGCDMVYTRACEEDTSVAPDLILVDTTVAGFPFLTDTIPLTA